MTKSLFTSQLLSAGLIELNKGQIAGVPANPRIIRDARFAALKKSITDFPDMLDLREVVVFPHKRKFICIGGNMRFRACQELGFKEIPVKIIPKEFPIEKVAEFAMKDNINFGQPDLDMIAEQWSHLPLQDWGAEIPDFESVNLDEFFKEDTTEEKPETFSIVLEYKTKKECDKVKQALLEHGQTYELAVRKLLKL